MCACLRAGKALHYTRCVSICVSMGVSMGVCMCALRIRAVDCKGSLVSMSVSMGLSMGWSMGVYACVYVCFEDEGS